MAEQKKPSSLDGRLCKVKMVSIFLSLTSASYNQILDFSKTLLKIYFEIIQKDTVQVSSKSGLKGVLGAFLKSFRAFNALIFNLTAAF